MPDIEVSIEIFCAKCGEGLCNQSTAGRTARRREPYFDVAPCEKCLEAARKEGYDEGFQEAVDKYEDE